MGVTTSAEFVGFLYAAVFFIIHIFVFAVSYLLLYGSFFHLLLLTLNDCGLHYILVSCHLDMPIPCSSWVCSWWTWVKLCPSSPRTHSFPRDPKKELHYVQEAMVLPHSVHFSQSVFPLPALRIFHLWATLPPQQYRLWNSEKAIPRVTLTVLL